MKINQPYALNEQGNRDNQEDNIFPQKGKATTDQHFFLVCDGMGGREGGEVASKIICETFAEYMHSIKNPEDFSEDVFNRALAAAYNALDNYDISSDDKKKEMGTTLTFLYLNDSQAFMAHIGDSRIYHLRKNEVGKWNILFKTSDHSLVNDLLKAGVIDEVEAADYPKKNVITRVMQPNLERRYKADLHETADVQAGDLFFLCSDGILESVNDETLLQIVAENNNCRKIITAIESLCNKNSHDNFSAYLVPVAEGITVINKGKPESTSPVEMTQLASAPVEKVKQENAPAEAAEAKTSVPTVVSKPASLPIPERPQKEKKKSNFSLWLIVFLLAAIAGLLAYNMFFKNDTPKEKERNINTQPIDSIIKETKPTAGKPMTEPISTPVQKEQKKTEVHDEKVPPPKTTDQENSDLTNVNSIVERAINGSGMDNEKTDDDTTKINPEHNKYK